MFAAAFLLLSALIFATELAERYAGYRRVGVDLKGAGGPQHDEEREGLAAAE